ncbi:bifunctional 2',3'-cyclic-nucleotide 2'-phosphodiesterase/3'-nucleotidase [Yoonia sp. 2307UL14-13]|uniref:bifunctional 2',3'-cyclic-nucleotide 2'-phosphodiesterase/3'-nucleotidase n=1 Tax=Yoonia sp. 2307UL14-13 TaxID=3126506 RepID=UPI0030B17B12
MTSSNPFPSGRLRILETTDLHMQVLPYDYFADRPDPKTGLLQLIGTIADLRAAPEVTTLLFDNGDFLQGNPLADYIAAHWETGDTHPMIAALNTIRYDAITLGNHEFNYGLDYLQDVLADAAFPITCANLRHLDDLDLAGPYLILDRTVTCSDGQDRPIRVGVIGFLPPQITTWDHATLAERVETEDIVTAAQRIIPKMISDGADIIIALCHSGIEGIGHVDNMENAAVPLAAVPGIDVMLTGHTHELFPHADATANGPVDPVAGTLHGKPAVMAGFYGGHLGQIDLVLDWTRDGWVISQHCSRLRTGATSTDPSAAIIAQHMAPAHKATLDHIRQPIATTSGPIHSYFADIGHDHAQQLLARAQQDFARDLLAETPYHDLPILSATSPFRAGGRAGPDHYVDIAPGPLTLRDAAAIYPFPNTFCALRRTGRQIRDWLQVSAARFAGIAPGQQDQPLINPRFPGYNHDSLFGISYRIDLQTSHIVDLTHDGKPVQDDDVFIVATNSYRAGGGGGIVTDGIPDIVLSTTDANRDILIAYLRDHPRISVTPQPLFQFSPIPGTAATFLSAPAAQDHLPENVFHLGPGPQGFHRYRICF